VVDNYLPTLVGLLEDEGKKAFGASTVFLAAVEFVLAEADGVVLAERVDFKLGEGEGAHAGLGRVVVVVLLDEAAEAAGELAGDEDGVGGVFVSEGESVDIAAVPGGLLGEEDLDDAELPRGGHVQIRGGVLSVDDQVGAAESERKKQMREAAGKAARCSAVHGDPLGEVIWRCGWRGDAVC
jgi:hypothetical protein